MILSPNTSGFIKVTDCTRLPRLHFTSGQEDLGRRRLELSTRHSDRLFLEPIVFHMILGHCDEWQRDGDSRSFADRERRQVLALAARLDSPRILHV